LEDWLRSIGLGERYASFRDQGITFDQVADLTDDDLRELGLTIGDRKRFQRAVAALQPKEAAVGGSAPVLETTRAERRPLTMMFVDLVNSSALGERLEPEDLMEVIRRYREFAGTAITRVGGMIGRLVGDGILAYFCYPMATENDPERAVRAALEIVRGIGALETPAGTPLNVRIGIATGQVIVSDLFAGGEDMRTIIGSTPNLAARLQGFAPTGGIVVAEETYARIGGMFVCEDLGKREVKGFGHAHNAWRVVGEASDRGRDGRTPPRLTPFYNRQAELAIVAQRWKRARDGEDGTVLVMGEAGIGKSRLIEQFLAAHIDASAHVIRLAGSALDEDSPLHPVIAYLRLTARLEPDEPQDVQIEKLAATLAGDAATRRAVLPVFAELAGIPSVDPALRALSPESLRERMLSVLIDQILLWAADKPLCLLVEDLHWLDPTSRELLGRAVESVAGRPVMILLTARDGFEATWTARRATTVVRLVPLSPGDVADMVQSLFTSRDIPPHIGRLIARRTDGVPLFVEEVARGLLQSHSLDDLGDDTIDLPDQAIPASLRESLMARLDRSGVAKQIAQIAAVIGRTARRDILAVVASLPAAALNEPLAALLEAGVLFRELIEGAEGYTFSHALLRDAAYDSLVREDRRQLHLRVARALAEHDPLTVGQQPELLAMHLAEGNEPEAAAPHWLEAARRSLARSALTEATRLLRRGLDALEKLPPTEAVRRLRVELSGLLGPAMIGLRGPGSPEAQAVYASAYALCNEMAEEPSHFPIYWGWWRVAQDFHTWLDRSDAILRRAARHDHPEFLLQAHHSNWASHYHAGNFARCCEHIEAGLALYEHGDFRHHATLYGNHDPKVCAHGEWAQLLWLQGRPHSAFASAHAAMQWAESLGHHGSRVHASDTSLLHHVYRRDYNEVFRHAGELVSFTSAHAMSDHRSKGLIFRGWITAMQDDAATGLQTLRDGLAYQRDGTAREDFPVYLCLLAEAQMAAGRPELAVDELRQALSDFDRLGLYSWRPEVLRVLGETILAADPAAMFQAEALFSQSAAIADQQGAVMLRLRTAVSQARLGLRQDRVPEGARILSSAIAAIVEDDDGLDLREARQMAARLDERLGRAATILGTDQ
jgi:class 3 adenylate cyclase/predicted ATPase